MAPVASAVGAPDVLRDGARLRVVNGTRGSVLAEDAEVAASSWSRMRGLLGRPPLAPGQGLLIVPCQGVHTLGMAYPIDVVHLDREGVVHKVLHELKPWRTGPLVWRASVVLELAAGGAAEVAVGDRLALEPLEPDEMPSPAASEPPGFLHSGTHVVRLLCDRFLPALFFGLAALGRFVGLLEGVQHEPTDLSLQTWLAYVLFLAHHALAFLFLAVIATLFLLRRTPQSRAGPLAMAIALLGSFIMAVALVQPASTQDWRVLALADFLMATGLAFTIYGAVALRDCFGLAPEARGLVTTGAYRLVRHPLYLGEFVTFLGALLPVLAPSTALIFILFCLLQATRAALEEQVLGETFAEYAAYRRRTPALLPWPRPR